MFPRWMRPIRLSRRKEPFDSDEFLFELKIDGFRALAHIMGGKGELISRNGKQVPRLCGSCDMDCRTSPR
jgi:ATP-dependent DNA ligase